MANHTKRRVGGPDEVSQVYALACGSQGGGTVRETIDPSKRSGFQGGH